MFVIYLIIIFIIVHRGFLGYPVPQRNYRYLSRIDAGFLKAAGEAMFPAGGAIRPSCDEAGIIPWVDDYLSWLSGSQRVLVRLLFILFEHGTAVFKPSYRRMSQLSSPEIIEYLDGWENSSIYLRRMAFQSLRAILCMAYCHDAQVEKEMGYFRPTNCQKNAERELQ